MIIRCDQCKTRFRLDDSKVTVSGVRVRCSKCKHTFVVRKDADEEESVIEETFHGTESTPAEAGKQDDDPIGAVTGQTETGQKSDEIKFPFESDAASGQDSPTESVSDKSSSIEDDFILFKAGSSDYGPVPAAEEPEEEKSPVQWPVEQETEEQRDRKEDYFQITTKAEAEEKETISWGSEDFFWNGSESNSRPDETVEGVPTESSYQIHPPETGRDQLPEGSPADIGTEAKVHYSGGTDDFSLGDATNGEKDAQLLIEKDQPVIAMDAADAGTTDKTHDLADVPEGNLAEANGRETVPYSFETGGESDLSLHRSEVGAEEDLPPLSITSRRKSTLFPAKAFAGILILVFLILLAGLYSFRTDFASINIPGFSAVKNRLLTGQWKKEEIVIKNLDGTFVRNNHGVDIFVIRGEAFNQSGKASSTVRIKGYIYDTKGEVLLNRLARFGQVLSNDQLAALPVSEIEALSANQPGNIPQDLIMLPGKRIPFQIIFGHVPEGAGEFGAEVVASAGSVP